MLIATHYSLIGISIKLSLFPSYTYSIGRVYGGAILGAFSVIVTGSVFRNNSVVAAGEGQAGGGALSANVAVRCNDTLFDGNSAVASGDSLAGIYLHMFICAFKHDILVFLN